MLKDYSPTENFYSRMKLFMKIFKFILAFSITLSFISLSTYAQEKALILDYSVGFQAGWSTLHIFSDGSIEHLERVCCPPIEQPVSEKPLTESQFKELKNLIAEIIAHPEPVLKKNNVSFAFGYNIGTLYIYTVDGQIIVKQLIRTELGHGDILYIDNLEARELEKWVYSLGMVQNKLELF